jgi:hypothetical protein
MDEQEVETELSKHTDIYKLDDLWYRKGTGPGPIGGTMAKMSGEVHQDHLRIVLDKAGAAGILFDDALKECGDCWPEAKNLAIMLRKNLRAMRERDEAFNDPKTDRWWSAQYAPEEFKQLVLETTRPTGIISIETNPPTSPHPRYGHIAVTPAQIKAWRDQSDVSVKAIIAITVKSTRNYGVTSSELYNFIAERLGRLDLLQQGKATDSKHLVRVVGQTCRFVNNIYRVVLAHGFVRWFYKDYGPAFQRDHELRDAYVSTQPPKPVGRPKKVIQEVTPPPAPVHEVPEPETPAEVVAMTPAQITLEPGYEVQVQMQIPLSNVAAFSFRFKPNGPETLQYQLGQPVVELIGIEPTKEQREQLILMAPIVYQVTAYEQDYHGQLREIPGGTLFAHYQTVYILEA